MAHICKIIFNATCQSRCVLNVLWSCYLNQRFCKFWIYFSKYYRTLGSWPVTYLSFGPVGIRWYGWQDRREVLHKVSSLCFIGKLDSIACLLQHNISSMDYQGEWCVLLMSPKEEICLYQNCPPSFPPSCSCAEPVGLVVPVPMWSSISQVHSLHGETGLCQNCQCCSSVWPSPILLRNPIDTLGVVLREEKPSPVWFVAPVPASAGPSTFHRESGPSVDESRPRWNFDQLPADRRWATSCSARLWAPFWKVLWWRVCWRGTHVGGVKVKRWGGEEGVWMWVWWGGNCDERKRVRVSKMGWRSTRVTMVNILSWTLMNTFMVVSVRARQDQQTPSYEELGEMEKIFQHFFFSKY